MRKIRDLMIQSYEARCKFQKMPYVFETTTNSRYEPIMFHKRWALVLYITCLYHLPSKLSYLHHPVIQRIRLFNSS